MAVTVANKNVDAGDGDDDIDDGEGAGGQLSPTEGWVWGYLGRGSAKIWELGICDGTIHSRGPTKKKLEWWLLVAMN